MGDGLSVAASDAMGRLSRQQWRQNSRKQAESSAENALFR
jgi:hypothetical protein